VKKKVVSEVLRKYDVCEGEVSDATTPRQKSTNPSAGISYAN
jgi:hypothetical protein